PCLMRWPGRFSPGTVSDEVVWSLDLFPAFARAAGVTEDLPLHDGEDLLKRLEEEESGSPRSFLWQTGAHAELGRKSWIAYREGSLKYLSSPADGEFLFDLANDPHETSDLKEEMPDEFQRLKGAALQLSNEYRAEENP
ncbi:MAG: hypothetical protein AAF491_09400, partial [Verrucomicrobiota bacterium]